MNADVHGGKTMAGNLEDDSGRRGSGWRIAAWTAAALILLLPLIAMQFTDEVVWDVTDFAVFGALLVGVGVTFEFAARGAGLARKTRPGPGGGPSGSTGRAGLAFG
jgi:hypothetical protein